MAPGSSNQLGTLRSQALAEPKSPRPSWAEAEVDRPRPRHTNPLTSTVGTWYRTAIKHPVSDRSVKSSFVSLTSGHSDAQHWASERPDVKNYKWRLNTVWHRMLYSSTNMATAGVKGLISVLRRHTERDILYIGLHTNECLLACLW